MCVCAFERDREMDLNCECDRQRERENWHVNMCGIEIKTCISYRSRPVGMMIKSVKHYLERLQKRIEARGREQDGKVVESRQEHHDN